MARVGVTLKLLHGEYVDATAAAGDPAMGYDRSCRTYQRHVVVTGAASRVGQKAGQRVALAGRIRSPRYAHLEPLLATGQDVTASLRRSLEEPVEVGGFVRGADYYAGEGAR